MNTLVLAFFAIVAAAAAAPTTIEPPIAIVSQISELNPDGTYVNNFETTNGIKVSEEGSTKVDGENVIQIAKGKFSYPAPDGTLIETEWYTDENGFHASGGHLPVGPETPAYIARALEWSAAHPQEDEEEKKL